jgi:hydrogenase maturation protease
MSSVVEQIADALLYEGYMLYPYRRSSVKNRQRFNFGVLHPQSYLEGRDATGADRSFMQTECLVLGNAETTLRVRVRFLQLAERLTLREATERWEEATEREVDWGGSSLGELIDRPRHHPFAIPPSEQVETLPDPQSRALGIMVRRERSLCGEVEVSARWCRDGVAGVRVRIANGTDLPNAGEASRDDALLRSLVSCHAILTASEGEFVSLLDPPEALAELAGGCENVGAWPVLAGDEARRDTLLASPIILYDYPTVAPESAGDLFDGTEIDEILSLRIMTLTDEEKQEVRRSDERARRLLERTEALTAEQLMRLHGVLRLP